MLRKRTDHEQRVFTDALQELGTLFSHRLTTVWMIPPKKAEMADGVPAGELRYNHAWAEYLR